MMDVYVVMEWGDDYHGSRPVRAFTDEGKAGVYARDCDVNQLRDCGSETCDHKYSYVVHKIPMDKGVEDE